ncbi:hypothetical protein HNQ91_000594 [Filimonas zeae]|nr:hypothetical protein [Filimonas zeae]
MQDWIGRLDAFLQFNDYVVLKDAGKISHEIARSLAENEYEQFRKEQDAAFRSDFDKSLPEWKDGLDELVKGVKNNNDK